MTLIEITVSLVVLVLLLLGFMQAIVSSMRLSGTNREVAIATEAAREMVEALQDELFPDIFSLFNSTPADDPAGIGTAPGSNFAVAGLDPRVGDADGLAGEILFPAVPGLLPGELQLREDFADPTMGMPRDLNGDAVVDAVDHASDYLLLPVTVRVEWRGSSGLGRVELSTLIAQR